MLSTITGNKLFPSNKTITQTLNKLKPKSEEFVKITLEPKEGKAKHEATAYVFDDLEAVATNCDAYFNNNKFEYIDVLCKGKPGLFISFGADKSTDRVISVYLQSFACIGGYKTGVNESTANCFVYGDFKDDNFHLTELYQRTGKRETIEILSRKPTLITLCIKNIKYKSYFFSSGIFHFDRQAHYEKNRERNKNKKIRRKLIEQWKTRYQKEQQEYKTQYEKKISELDENDELEMKANKPREMFGLDEIQQKRKGRQRKHENKNRTWQRSFKNGLKMVKEWTIPIDMLPICGISPQCMQNNNKTNHTKNAKNNKNNNKNIAKNNKNTNKNVNNNIKSGKQEIDEQQSDSDISINNDSNDHNDNNNNQNNNNDNNDNKEEDDDEPVLQSIQDLLDRSCANNQDSIKHLPHMDEFTFSQSMYIFIICTSLVTKTAKDQIQHPHT